MSDLHPPPRIATSTRATGATLNELIANAMIELDVFFGERRFYEITEVRARPLAQALGGRIFVWEADVEAAQVWG